MPTMLPSMNALNTHPYSRSPPRLRATTGMTVITASASAATNVMASTRPVVSARFRGAHNPSRIPVLPCPHLTSPRPGPQPLILGR